MNIKVDFDNIVVKEDKNDFNVKVLMLKGEKGDAGEGEDNIIEKVQVNGTDLPVTNKAVNVVVPIVDSTLSSSSTNPVQNKVIYDALSDKADTSELSNYYEISEVDNLVNSKVDTTTFNTNITNETTARINADANLQSQITSLANGSPLVASSTSEMTDTSRVYVNSTDGHWYYYDGSSWQDGGVYQSTGIEEKSILPEYTTFYEIYNLLPKFGWIEGKVFGNSGGITNYSTGCYNEEYVEVDATQNLFIIQNDKFSSNYMKVMQYDENKQFLSSFDFTNNKSRQGLNSSCKFIRFTFWTEKFTTLPDNFPIVIQYNQFIELNSYYKLAKLKDEYNNKINTNNVVIDNNIHFSSLIYTYNYTTDYSNIKFNEVNDVTINGTITGSIVLIGTYLNIKDIKKNDLIYVNLPQLTQTPEYVDLWRNGDSTVLRLRKIKDTLYVGSVNDAVIQYKEQLRCVMRFAGLNSGQEFTVRIKMNINSQFSTLYEYLEKNNNKKNFILLGDSITHMTGTSNWFLYLQEKLNANLIENVAVDGACLKDYNDTGSYDGNPTDGSHNNVLGNQVQKILNNNYDAPDIIMIAIGTNGGITATDEEIYNTYYGANQTLISVDNVNRQTDAGAFRWCNEKLHAKYPNAKIIWCTPIQGTARSTQAIINWGDALKRLCAWGSNYCCDTEKCGISITNATEYLADGLHPNIAGATLMGTYNASEISKFMNK